MTKNIASNAPTHIVWFAPKREGAPWIRIGALWPTKKKDGGFRMHLELMPMAEGSTIIMPNEPKATEGKGA